MIKTTVCGTYDMTEGFGPPATIRDLCAADQ